MHIFTHFFTGWLIAERTCSHRRDMMLVTTASVIPDADGAGMAVDMTMYLMGYGFGDYYERFHHLLGHGLPAAIAFTLLAWFLAVNRLKTCVWVFIAFHSHLLLDLLGSRGGNMYDIWTINYLAPISNGWEWSWQGQWPLTSWQNTLIACLLIAYTIRRTVYTGCSPVYLFHIGMDLKIVKTLRARFRQRRQSQA